MKTLCIHVGHYKTGTTSLQVFCHKNAELLKEGGVTYSGLWRENSKHSIYAFSLYRAAGVKHLMHGYNFPTPPEELWATLFDEVRSSDTGTTLISSEEFMRLAEFPDAVERLTRIVANSGGGINIRILVWLRPVGSHLKSWYNQLVKMNQLVPHFAETVTEHMESIHYDYRKALTPFRDIFGADALEIYAYPGKRSTGGELFSAYLGALGLELPLPGADTVTDPNPRMDDRMVNIVRLLQNAELPPPVVKAARHQMGELLSRRDGMVPPDPGRINQVARRAEAAIERIGEMGKITFDPAVLKDDLTSLHDATDPDIAIEFLLTEFLRLRRRVNLTGLEQLAERISRLEAAVGTPEEGEPG